MVWYMYVNSICHQHAFDQVHELHSTIYVCHHENHASYFLLTKWVIFFNLYEFQYELLAHVPSISLTLCLCTNNITLWLHDCLCTFVCVSCCCRYFPPTSHSVVLAFATHSFTSGLCLKTDATRYCPTSWRHLTETLSAPSERVICFINHRRANECCLMWWRCDRIFHAFDSQRTMKYTCRPAYCLFVIHVMTEFN